MSLSSGIDFKKLFETVPGLYMVLDPQLIIVAASNNYISATLQQRKEMVGRHLFEVFPDNPDDPNADGVSNLRASLEYVLKYKRPHTMPVQKYDVSDANGVFHERYWAPLNTPVFNEAHEITHIIHRAEDVTILNKLRKEEMRQRQEIIDTNQKLKTEIEERKKIEQQYLELQAQLQQQVNEKTAELTGIFERITDGFIALDKNFRYTFANKRIGELTRRDPSSLIGKNIWDEFPDAVGSSTYNAFIRAMYEQRYSCNTDYFEPLDLWQENHFYPSPEGLSVFIRDITEQKRQEITRMAAEKRLQESHEELKQLTTHLQNIREEEQKRIAREVHDELGQQITGLKMDVSWMKKKINNPKDVFILEEKLTEMSSLLDSAVVTIRKISSELRPTILDDLGLIAALEWQTREFEKRFEIPVTFETTVRNLEVDPNVATGIFRIYQESLTNVARHSGATHIASNFAILQHNLVLTVNDNGKGFDSSNAGQAQTLGLRGMKERAEMMDGALDIESKPGKGTKVIISVPVNAQVLITL